MIVESVKKYFEELASISVFNNAINVNYLDDEINYFSIEEIPTSPIIKRYANGTTLRQYQFSLNSRAIYNEEILQNIENSGFYEKLCEEIEQKDNDGILPILKGNKQALNLEITSTPVIISNDSTSAIYQINFNLKYIKGVE